jgi:cell division protein FtsA
MVAKDLIVAIELGSSKITGIVGRKNVDGSLQIVALAQEKSTEVIRKGVIRNIDKTALSITNIINRLQGNIKLKIEKVYVGIGGKSLHTVKNTVVRHLETKTIISQELVDAIMDANRNTQYPDMEILEVIPQEYVLGTEKVTDPVGILSDNIEGVFLNVVARRTLSDNIKKCFQLADVDILDTYIAPIALGECVLSESEKRSGCCLVDFGADTTTVSIYKNNILRHLNVIPLGSSNINKDLCSLQMEDEVAEKLKKEHGSAYCDLTDDEKAKLYPIGNERNIDGKTLAEVIEAREEEIVTNVYAQIDQAGFRSQLLAGLIATGGGANIPDLDKAFGELTKLDKFKAVKEPQIPLHATQPEILAKDGRMNTIIGLLYKGKENCCGRDLSTGDIFENPVKKREDRLRELNEEQKRRDEAEAAAKAKEVERKQAEADAAAAAEEERKREEAKAEKKRKADEKAAANAARKAKRKEKRDNFKKKISNFLNQIIGPEE